MWGIRDHLVCTSCHGSVRGMSDVCFQQSPYGKPYFIKALRVLAMSISDSQRDSLSL